MGVFIMSSDELIILKTFLHNHIIESAYNIQGVKVKIKTRYPNEYLNILHLTKFLDDAYSKVGFGQHIYCILHDVYTLPECIICKSNTVRFKNYSDGWRQFCSMKCLHKHLIKPKHALYCSECSTYVKTDLATQYPTGVRCKECEHICRSRSQTKNWDNIKSSPDRFAHYHTIVSNNMKNRWKTLKTDHPDIYKCIFDKIRNTQRISIDKLSTVERKNIFGWLNHIPNDRRESIISDILDKSLRKWWKDATPDQLTEVYQRRRLSMLQNGGWNITSLDEFNTMVLNDYMVYRNKVGYLTEKSYVQFKHIINPNNLIRSRDGFQLDHKYSIQSGYINKIPPEIISHYINLEMFAALDNNSKNYKCSISKEDLINKYESLC